MPVWQQLSGDYRLGTVAVTVSEQDANKVMAVLEDRSPIGLDTHRQQVEGRDVEEASGADEDPMRTRERQEEEEQEQRRERTENTPEKPRSARRDAEAAREETEEEEIIPLGEERLEVGKRTVNRGTTRIAAMSSRLRSRSRSPCVMSVSRWSGAGLPARARPVMP